MMPTFYEEKMKKERKMRYKDIELYKSLEERVAYDDYNYYGLFYKRGKLRIDPKRYAKVRGMSAEMKKIANITRTHYFTPKKNDRYDYNCNIFNERLNEIKNEWAKDFKPIIDNAINSIANMKKLTPGDYVNLMCGISSVGSAQAWANWQNFINEQKVAEKKQGLLVSMYAQFFHLMASKIEALTIYVLTKNGFKKDRFDRCSFYNFKSIGQSKFEQLDDFKSYDKMYCIWNFIKHNSLITYKTLKDRYPKTLCEGEYSQGQMAIYWLKIDENVITEILEGIQEFFKNYCKLVFNEDFDEAQWNYNAYFETDVKNEIECFTNPLGLQWWDEID